MCFQASHDSTAVVVGLETASTCDDPPPISSIPPRKEATFRTFLIGELTPLSRARIAAAVWWVAVAGLVRCATLPSGRRLRQPPHWTGPATIDFETGRIFTFSWLICAKYFVVVFLSPHVLRCGVFRRRSVKLAGRSRGTLSCRPLRSLLALLALLLSSHRVLLLENARCVQNPPSHLYFYR
ncbi:hypothetical protein MRX96_002071 [Rhipicephalus microplus]